MKTKKKPQGKLLLDSETSKINLHAKEEMAGRAVSVRCCLQKALTGLEVSKEGKEAGEQG